MREFHADVPSLRTWTRADGKRIDLISYVKGHPIGQAAEERTGHTVEEILSKSGLLMGDVQFIGGWIVESDGFTRAEDQFCVRLLLCFAWQLSTLPNQDEWTDRALASVADEITTFCLSERLSAQQNKLDAEQQRRRAGGLAASENRKGRYHCAAEIWRNLEGTPKHDRAAIIAKRLQITPGTVRRHLKKAGLR